MAAETLPWAVGAATGVGSMPGEDIAEAVSVAFGECPDLPFLPELPARGVGADVIGRGAALLAGLHVDLQPAGWRLVDRGGLDERRARSLLSRDLDALEEHAGSYAGPLKVAAAGPWTLAATVELPRGGRALADPGAANDLAASLAEGLTAHLADLTRRVPAATFLLQLDEPALPAVLSGRVPTASGFRTLRSVSPPVAADALGSVLAAVASAGALPLVHCCAPEVPVPLLVAAGVRAVSLDLTQLPRRAEEALGTATEAGIGLLLGVLPAVGAELSNPATSVDLVSELWRRLGLQADKLSAVALTPACGLAGASPGYAKASLRHCREAARRLAEGGA
jgi:methionine synthase II (cobalamin-independent)